MTYQILCRVAGIGLVLALILLYEIHDIARFPEPGNLLSCCRLVLCAHLSVGKVKGFGEKDRQRQSDWLNDLAADLSFGGLTLTAGGRPSTVTGSQATDWGSPSTLPQTLQARPNPQGPPRASWSSSSMLSAARHSSAVQECWCPAGRRSPVVGEDQLALGKADVFRSHDLADDDANHHPVRQSPPLQSGLYQDGKTVVHARLRAVIMVGRIIMVGRKAWGTFEDGNNELRTAWEDLTASAAGSPVD
jgi:hypothetical protein